MDFTLSLAHFCELHGPTSMICTQALPSECSTCYATTTSTPTTPSPAAAAAEPPSYFLSPKRPTSSGPGLYAAISDGDRCASCRMSLPDDAQPSRILSDRPPLRTKEDVHVCGVAHADADDDDSATFAPGSQTTSQSTLHSDESCHSHRLVYLSSSSPVDAEAFATMRRATVRTLSGEQLPRGQTSGPLWFGDPAAGYTIAYVFRLADLHARGRQRYYALLALAGTDTTRAFEACTLIWDLFEQIATRIIRSAEAVAAKTAFDESPPQQGTITPISSFLTGRTTDPDGFPRRGTANVRANGIAELVDNENFFCELHMIFVSMLQELGRSLGGMRVRPVPPPHAESAKVEGSSEEVSPRANGHANGEARQADAKFSRAPAAFDLSKTEDASQGQYPTPLCSPSILDTRQEVTV